MHPEEDEPQGDVERSSPAVAVQSGDDVLPDDDLRAAIKRLRAENEALKQGKRSGATSMKVSENGALSVYA